MSPPPTATGVITALGPVSSDDSCSQVFVAGQPAGYDNRLCASITVGSTTCPIDAFFYSFIAPKYNVGENVLIGCVDGVLKRIQALSGSGFSSEASGAVVSSGSTTLGSS